jgi:hypothetical protein
VSPLERQFSSRIRMGKGISRAIHRKGKMLYWLCCRTALTRLLRSRLLAHRVTSRRRSNSLAFGSKRHSAKQLPPSRVYEYAP